MSERLLATTTHRRAYPRFAGELGVEILCDDQECSTHHLGSTVNLSGGGIYFQTVQGAGLKVGQKVMLRLHSLDGEGAPAKGRSVQLWATIRRINGPSAEGDSFSTFGIGAEFLAAPATAVLELVQ